MVQIAHEAMKHLTYLAKEIGCRPIGSPQNHQAADYIADTFRQAGLNTSFQDFLCPDWIEEASSLSLGGKALEAYANTFSPSCELTAPTVTIGTLDELEITPISSKIVIFIGELAQHELAAKAAIYVSDRDRRIIQIIEERRPAGLITVNPSLNERWRLIEDFDLEIPSVTVTARSGLQLVNNTGASVHMNIQTRRSPSHSANVVGRKEGALSKRIVLCAHYDTKVDTPGAYDNASGVACMLTVLQCLAPARLRHTIEWIAFSGEEIYGLGDMTYAERIGENFGKISAAINTDGVGPALSTNSLAIFAGSKYFEELVLNQKSNYPKVALVEPWPASDHYIFYSHGVPSLALSSLGVKDNHHTPEDTIEWINPDKLVEVMNLTINLIQAIDEKVE